LVAAIWFASAGATLLYWVGAWLVLPLVQPVPPFPAAAPGDDLLLLGAFLLLALAVSISMRVAAAYLPYARGESCPAHLARALRRRLLLMLAMDGVVMAIVVATLLADVGLVNSSRPGWLGAQTASRLLPDLLSFWPMLACLAGLDLLRLVRRVMADPPYCPCGYSLKGHASGSCPECGRPIATPPDPAGAASADGAAAQAVGGQADRSHRKPFLLVGLGLVAAGVLGGPLAVVLDYRLALIASAVTLALIAIGSSWVLAGVCTPIRSARQQEALRRFAKVSGLVDGLVVLVAVGLFAAVLSGVLTTHGGLASRASISGWSFMGAVFAWDAVRKFALWLPATKT
jgi:hypothetical protein